MAFRGSLVVTNFHWSLVRTTQMLHFGSVYIFEKKTREIAAVSVNTADECVNLTIFFN